MSRPSLSGHQLEFQGEEGTALPEAVDSDAARPPGLKQSSAPRFSYLGVRPSIRSTRATIASGTRSNRNTDRRHQLTCMARFCTVPGMFTEGDLNVTVAPEATYRTPSISILREALIVTSPIAVITWPDGIS